MSRIPYRCSTFSSKTRL